MKTKQTSTILPAIALLLMLGPANLEARESRALPLRGLLDGGITLSPSGTDSITLEAKMRGFATPVGPAQAVATWTTGAARFAQLQTGVVDELTIGNGTLSARTFWGTVSGNFTGTLRRHPSGAILFEASYTLNSGSGFLAGASGSGQMDGISDSVTFAFRLFISGRIKV
jgi:hypothetical protein